MFIKGLAETYEINGIIKTFKFYLMILTIFKILYLKKNILIFMTLFLF